MEFLKKVESQFEVTIEIRIFDFSKSQIFATMICQIFLILTIDEQFA